MLHLYMLLSINNTIISEYNIVYYTVLYIYIYIYIYLCVYVASTYNTINPVRTPRIQMTIRRGCISSAVIDSHMTYPGDKVVRFRTNAAGLHRYTVHTPGLYHSVLRCRAARRLGACASRD